jgi:DNA repair exonuclease SbcCD ATPase subunit
MGIVGGVGWFAYNYYVTTQTRIGILTANNAKLETAQKQTVAEFEQYRNKVTKDIEEFKAELVKQQELNNELNNNLKKSEEANKAIAKLLANTDIIKNSLADPKASEDKINEEVDNFFGAISCATGDKCVQSNP